MINTETIKRVLLQIKRQADYEYFFSQIASPEWIKPLKEAGLFSSPPEPVVDGQYITFVTWPESQYLVRMADSAPEIVAEIALQIPDTLNTRVNDDLNTIALSLSSNLAVKFAPKIKKWMASAYAPIFPEKLGKFIAHVARGGYSDEAIDLAGVVLAVLPDPREAEKDSHESEFRPHSRPRARFDLWDYRILIKEVVPALAAAAQMRSFKVFCSLLNDAIRLSQSHGEDSAPYDYSYIWRRAIEHPPDIDDIPNALVSAVRDIGEEIARADAVYLPQLVESLSRERWSVFHRIALHLLRLFPDASPDLASSWLTNKARFEALELWHEYFVLVRERFPHLDPSQQETILGWIDAGPDTEAYIKRQQQWFGEFPSEDTVKKHAMHWKLRRLASIRDSLPPDWKEKYSEWEASVGPLEFPEYASPPSTVRWGLESPKSQEDLSAMSLDQFMTYLDTWRPSSNNPLGPTYEGLGQRIGSLVKADPRRFATEARRFIGFEPTYVRSLISGFREAMNAKFEFEWPAVLDLCLWVVDEPLEERERTESFIERDPDWSWTRGAIGHLLSEGLKREAGDAQIPFEFRDTVWKIILRLTEDPNPTPEHEARYGGSNMEPMTLSLNTNRGQAMHCVMHYALWSRSHLEEVKHSTKLEPQSFEHMREIRDALDKHLDRKYDPSLAIRAVYGVWLPWLVDLDETWVINNLFRIFPIERHDVQLRDAAWKSYILFNQAWDNTFKVLRNEYERSVELIGKSTIENRREDPDRSLGEHLMVLYGRGHLTLDSQDLISRFFSVAPDDLREHALSFIGQSLINSKEPFPTEILEKFEALWVVRLREAQDSSNSLPRTKELAAFGVWFASAKFDDTWAITNLIETLKLSGSVEAYHLVIERLAELSPRMPRSAVECLALMIEGDREGWNKYSWQQETRAILDAAIRSQDSSARTAAEVLIHRLRARDRAYHYLRDLVSPQPSE